MMALVVGASGSGKSRYAEELVSQISAGRRIYLATMAAKDEESLSRIARHRVMRAGKGFETVECCRGLSGVSVPPESTVLLECMGTLCANELFGGSGAAAGEEILRGVEHLRRSCSNLVIVSNEVCSGGCEYEGDTLAYLRLLGRINCMLAQCADCVVEVVDGIPVYHKEKEGSMPC